MNRSTLNKDNVRSGSEKEARDERLTKSETKDRWRSTVDLALGFRFQTHKGRREGPEMTKFGNKKY